MMKRDTYFYIAVVFIVVALISIVVLTLQKHKGQVSEGFAGMGVSFKVKADREFADNQGYFYSIPPNLQGILAPRFSGTASYGPWLNTKMPSRTMQGVPVNPLTYQNTIKKCSNGVNVFNSDMKMKNGASKGCGQTTENFSTVPPNFSAGNYAFAEDSLKRRNNLITNDMLPEMSAEASMSVAQPIVYDRYIYANQKSRLYGLGDPIRGDIPIVPYNGDWFRPSVQPNIDLRDGAMMVMAGQDNATARNTMALMNAASGGTLGTFAGAPVMASQTDVGYGAGGADVIATAFP